MPDSVRLGIAEAVRVYRYVRGDEDEYVEPRSIFTAVTRAKLRKTAIIEVSNRKKGCIAVSLFSEGKMLVQ